MIKKARPTQGSPTTPNDTEPPEETPPVTIEGQAATPDAEPERILASGEEPNHVATEDGSADPVDPPTSGRATITPARPRRSALPWVLGIAVLVLVGALAYVLSTGHQGQSQDEMAAIERLQQQVQSLSAQVVALAQRPAPASVNLEPLTARVDAAAQQTQSLAEQTQILAQQNQALAQRTQAVAQQTEALANRPPPPSVAPKDFLALADRVTKLESAVTAMSDLSGRIGKLEAQVGMVAALNNRVAAMEDRIGAVAQNLKALSDQVQGRQEETQQALQAVQAKLDDTQKLAAQLTSLSSRAGHIAQIQAAQAALAAGQPLGTLPDAPPALARFAQQPPPTEAALRQSFPQAAQAALAAASPDQQGSFADRMWARAQQAVTVREGDKVLVGNPVAGILGRARGQLDAGDLAGATATLHQLTGPSAQAMQPWLAQADQLLAARTALADLAGRA